MELTLENQYLRVEISSMGAEITSIYHKDTNREYVWGGDPAVWGRHSPILFPNCGPAKDKKFIIEGKEYPAKQHGFARDCDHKLVCVDDELATLRLESSDKIRAMYPYKFAMKTTYKLEKNKISCRHKVINYDDKPIYFSFGFHTGIRCPFAQGTNSSDYSIVFQKNEDCTRLFSNDSGLMTHREEAYKPQSKSIPITDGIFTKSMILRGVASEYIQLEDNRTGDYCRIGHTDSPYTVLWSVPDDIRVVCIEPWYGLGDAEDSDGDFSKKAGINCLLPMEEFVCEQYIEIGNSKR
ncbi:MAG: aldose 1-epimerase family protein [Angelakisella sp.]